MALEFVFGEQHRPENLLILPMKTQSFVWGMFNFGRFFGYGKLKTIFRNTREIIKTVAFIRFIELFSLLSWVSLL
jgi:hypothetical protein